MDVDRIDRYRVTLTDGRRRTFRARSAADEHAAGDPGAKVQAVATWQVRYRDPDGRQRAKNFPTRSAADDFAAANRTDLNRGQWIDPSVGRRTFRQYAEEWRTIQIHQPGTAAKLEADFRNHVYPVIGDIPIAKLRPSHMQAWSRGLVGRLAPGTIKVIAAYVASALRAAVADGMIARTPWVNVSLPTGDAAQVVPWPVGNVDALREAMPGRYRALVTYCAATGVRQGEAFGLTLGQLHMLERQVDVHWQAQRVEGGGTLLCRPKTKASLRTLPLGKVALDALAAHMAAFPPVTVEMVHRERDGRTWVGEEQLVFTNTAGRPLRRSGFGEHVWTPTVKAAKLPPGAHMHELRHFYASMLIRHGLSPKVVQARLGHASIIETMDTYGHLWPDDDDRTREAVDAELSPARSLRRVAEPG